ncbi:unnamed protein product [Effrenium voratum]|nr:unnamed protein product [Effrenium voratum]
MDRLCYSRTFIDEPSRFREFEPRSASCPALRSRKAERAMWTELCREETASRTQVAQLRQRAETLHSSQDAFAPLALWPSPSTGSRAHPQLCRRPCTFFAKGSCPNGAQCAFCHLPHQQASLDKRMREQLAACSETELLQILRPHFQRHALATPDLCGFQETSWTGSSCSGTRSRALTRRPRRVTSFCTRGWHGSLWRPWWAFARASPVLCRSSCEMN